MIALYNSDDSFFEIKFIDGASTPISGSSVLSLNVVEELRKMTTGSINLNDKTGSLSAAFRPGMLADIFWGYKRPDKLALSLIPLFPGDYVAPTVRLGFRAMITDVGGSGDNKGKRTLSLTLRGGFGLAEAKRTKNYIGTRGSVVLEVLALAGVLPTLVFFDTMALPVLNDVKQSNETDFEFLRRLALEWKAEFAVGNDPLGNLVATFVSGIGLLGNAYSTLVTGAVGAQHTFNYGGGDPLNVISYEWEKSFLADGQGDQVRFVLGPAGTPVKITTAAKGGTVVAYELSTEKLFAEQERLMKEDGPAAAAQFVADIFNTTDFQSKNVQKFYSQVEQPFAPQGSGYRVKMKLIGHPKYTIAQIAKFNIGFPPEISKIDLFAGAIKHKLFKVTHNLSSAGYRNEIETRDLLYR